MTRHPSPPEGTDELVCPRCRHTNIGACPAATHKWLCRTCWHPFSDSTVTSYLDADTLRSAAEVLARRADTATRLQQLLGDVPVPRVLAALTELAHNLHHVADGAAAARRSEAA